MENTKNEQQCAIHDVRHSADIREVAKEIIGLKFKKTDTLKIKSGNIVSNQNATGTIENLVFCKNGVIKLKKNVVKSKL